MDEFHGLLEDMFTSCTRGVMCDPDGTGDCCSYDVKTGECSYSHDVKTGTVEVYTVPTPAAPTRSNYRSS